MVYQGRPTGGGSKKSLFNFIKLLKNDVFFTIVVGSKGWFYENLEEEKIDFYFFEEHKNIQNNRVVNSFFLRKIKSFFVIFFYGFKSLKFNYKLIKKEKIQIVILNETRDLYFIGIPGLFNGCKIVSFLRGEPTIYDLPRLLLSHQIISLSSKLINKLPNILKRKTTVIPNYIKIKDSILPVIKKDNPNIINLAWIGSIIPVKGMENLVKIINLIRNEPFIVNIYGDIPSKDYKGYKEKILTLIEELNLTDKFVFHGWKKDISIPIRQSDIVILTSKSEGLPRAILESMSFSKPVMAFDVGGVSDLIFDNINGFLIPYGDIEGYAEKLKLLINNKEKREEFGKKSLEIAKNHFDEHIVKKKLLKVFSTIL